MVESKQSTGFDKQQLEKVAGMLVDKIMPITIDIDVKVLKNYISGRQDLKDKIAGNLEAAIREVDHRQMSIFCDDNGDVTGFGIIIQDAHTDRIIKDELKSDPILVSSISLCCYRDGTILVADGPSGGYRSIEDEDETHPWVDADGDLSNFDTLCIKCPQPFLTKKLQEGAQLREVSEHKLAQGDYSEVISTEERGLVILHPSHYTKGLDADQIDGNVPATLEKVRTRFSLLYEEDHLAERAGCGEYDIVKGGDGSYYPKPITLYIVDEPVSFGAWEDRVTFEKGDIMHISRGLDGTDDRTVRKFTSEELEQLSSEGLIVGCDEHGKATAASRDDFSDVLSREKEPATSIACP